MEDWEELELEHEEDLLGRGTGGSGALPWLVWGILAVSLLLGLGFYLTRDPEGPPPGSPEQAVAFSPAASEPAEAPALDDVNPEEEPLELPPLSASDALVRRLLSELSAHPEIARFLLTDELVRHFVVSVASIAEGESPRSQLRHVRPEGAFEAERRGGRLYLDPATYRRYEAHAALFASLDASGLARLYRQLRPLFDEAFAELGLPDDRSFDETFARALAVLRAAPIVEGPIALRVLSVNYGFEDPKLEALSPAQQHLVRMGPENARLVQAKLGELAAALNLETRPES